MPNFLRIVMTTKPIAVPIVTPPKKVVFLNSVEQAQAIAFWKSGTMTLEKLSEKYKVNKSTLTRLFKKAGAEKNETKDATTKVAVAAVEEAILNDAAIYTKRVKETKEDHYKISALLTRIISTKVANAQKDGIPHSNIAGDMKSLHVAASALKILREERYATLGISPDDVADDRPLPDLIVQELTVEDIRKMAQDNMVGDEDLDYDDLGDEDFIEREEQNDKVVTE